MKNMIRIGGMASALCFVALAHGQGPSISDVAWAKMVKCAAIADDNARHSCTDDVFHEAGLITDETKAAAKRQSFGLQKKPEPIAAAAAAVQAPAAAATSTTSAAAPVSTAATAPAGVTASTPAPTMAKKEKASAEELEVTLAKVEKGGDGKFTLTTTDGAVWHQVETSGVTATPKQGQTMKIEAKSLGGYLCSPSKYLSFRCYRSK